MSLANYTFWPELTEAIGRHPLYPLWWLIGNIALFGGLFMLLRYSLLNEPRSLSSVKNE